MLPNIPPKIFSLSAVIVGYILIDDMTAREQNALGNWLMLVAQVLSTNAFYRQVMQERGLEPTGSKESERQNPPNNLSSNQNKNNNYRNSTNETEETLIMLEKMIKALKTEIETIKKEL
ncbi:MAG: hypothetical protein ACI4PE_00215 [Bacilli bacterium]